MKRFLASLVLLFCLFGVYANAQKVVVGPSRGYGVDGGAGAQSVTGTGTIPNAARLVKVATGWATGTLTLPAISAVSTDTCIRVEDGGNFIDGTHTLTLKGGVSDGLNGGAANGTVGPFTTPGSFLVACVSATNNWNVGSSVSVTASTPDIQISPSPGTGTFTIGHFGATAVHDANCGALTGSGTAQVVFDTPFTLARSCTLPAASALQAGQHIKFIDQGNGTLPAINSTNTETINRAGADKIAGATSLVMSQGYCAVDLVSDGTANFSIASNSCATVPVAQGGTGATSLAGHGAVVMNTAGTAQTTVAPGANGNVLTSNGTDWASSAPAGGSGAVSIAGATVVASNAANIHIASLSTTNQYHIKCWNIIPVTTGQDILLTFGESGVEKITGYEWRYEYGYSGFAGATNTVGTGDSSMHMTTNVHSTNGVGTLDIDLAGAATAMLHTAQWNITWRVGTTSNWGNGTGGGAYTTDTTAINDVFIKMASGNISGSCTAYAYAQ